MAHPIRCFTCSKVLGNKYERFEKYEDKEQAYKDLGIERYCCKRMLLTSIDTFEMFKNFTITDLHHTIQIKQETSTNRIYNAR